MLVNIDGKELDLNKGDKFWKIKEKKLLELNINNIYFELKCNCSHMDKYVPDIALEGGEPYYFSKIPEEANKKDFKVCIEYNHDNDNETYFLDLDYQNAYFTYESAIFAVLEILRESISYKAEKLQIENKLLEYYANELCNLSKG